uniref:hypothetical protein n=1 Tax=Klebsiella pneumoniae TaxID=573 RepID=UPI00132F6962
GLKADVPLPLIGPVIFPTPVPPRGTPSIPELMFEALVASVVADGANGTPLVDVQVVDVELVAFVQSPVSVPEFAICEDVNLHVFPVQPPD